MQALFCLQNTSYLCVLAALLNSIITCSCLLIALQHYSVTLQGLQKCYRAISKIITVNWVIYFGPLKRGVLYSGVCKVLVILTWDLDRSVL